MNDDNNLDLLDLDDDDSVDSLPDVPAFTTPRPKKPWLLLSVGISVIVLATYIIIHAIGDDSASTVEVDLDAPVEFVVEGDSLIDLVHNLEYKQELLDYNLTLDTLVNLNSN